MIDVTENELKIILDKLEKYVPDCEVRVFGSRFKWTAKNLEFQRIIDEGYEVIKSKRT